MRTSTLNSKSAMHRRHTLPSAMYGKICNSLVCDGQLYCHLLVIHGTKKLITRQCPGFVPTPAMKVAVDTCGAATN